MDDGLRVIDRCGCCVQAAKAEQLGVAVPAHPLLSHNQSSVWSTALCSCAPCAMPSCRWPVVANDSIAAPTLRLRVAARLSWLLLETRAPVDARAAFDDALSLAASESCSHGALTATLRLGLWLTTPRPQQQQRPGTSAATAAADDAAVDSELDGLVTDVETQVTQMCRAAPADSEWCGPRTLQQLAAVLHKRVCV